MVSRPLLTGIVYSYMYDWMLTDKFEGYRSNMQTFYVGAVGCLLLRYIEIPVMSLLGMKTY